MEIKIMFAVGRMGARNLPDDVLTIQQALNNVNSVSGGPTPSLDEDGLCGPKTIAAIQKFQVHHFGWSGADGRVDPNGQTIHKLNEYHGPGPTIYPHQRTLPIHATLLCPHGGHVSCVPRQITSPQVMMAEDTYIISGCPFHMGARPSPCITIRWLSPVTGPLTRESIGLCLSAEQIPQGNAIIVG